jgi:hypothetical protein
VADSDCSARSILAIVARWVQVQTLDYDPRKMLDEFKDVNFNFAKTPWKFLVDTLHE